MTFRLTNVGGERRVVVIRGVRKSDRMPLVFGLSIDEDLLWCAARISRNTRASHSSAYSEQAGDISYGKLADLRGEQKAGNLGKLIRECLNQLKKARPDLFEETEAVGISTIGLADQRQKALISIARKGWISEEDGAIVRFDPIVQEFFPNARREIGVQNDATAKCLAEYHWQDPTDRVDSVFLAMFSEGVNGGAVSNGLPVAFALHPEMGHIWPPLHPYDETHEFDPRRYSGCPAHSFCYEGVASGARIKKQWGKALAELQTNKAILDKKPSYPIVQIIAHYMAHFCWTGAVTVSPQRILLGGSVAFPAVVPLVVEMFALINKGVQFSGRTDTKASRDRRPYLVYPAMGRPGFISSARFVKNQDMFGALEVSRLTFHGQLPGLNSLSHGVV